MLLTEGEGLALVQRSPVKAAMSTYAAFLLCGSAPLLPFVFGVPQAALLATLLTALVFFLIGSVKSHWSTQRWYASGLEMLLIGLTAAGIAFVIGLTLERII